MRQELAAKRLSNAWHTGTPSIAYERRLSFRVDFDDIPCLELPGHGQSIQHGLRDILRGLADVPLEVFGLLERRRPSHLLRSPFSIRGIYGSNLSEEVAGYSSESEDQEPELLRIYGIKNESDASIPGVSIVRPTLLGSTHNRI